MWIEEMDDAAVDFILDALSSEDRLSAWERSFVESIRDQWDRNRSLSERQKECLGNIWDKY